MIPKRLGDFIKLTGGGTPSKDRAEFWNGKIPWASVKDMKSLCIDNTENFITEAGVKNSATNVIPANSLLIATRMAVGRVAFNSVPMAINQDLKAVTCTEEIDSKYLFYLLESKEDYFNSIASGATVKGIKIGDITELKIPLPPLPIQRKIAEVLDAADRIRQRNKEVLKKYDQLAQSVFLEMFGDPVKNEKGWEVKELGTLQSRKSQNGLYVPKDQYDNSGTMMIHMSDAFYGKVRFEKIKYVKISDSEISKYSVDNQDILVARRSLNYEGAAKPCLIPIGNKKLVYESSLIRVTPNQRFITPLYLFFFLSNSRAKDWYVLKHVTRSTISGINNKGLNSIEIVLPPIDLQNQFATIIERIEQQKAQAQAELEQSEALFGSLMQRAFRGELNF